MKHIVLVGNMKVGKKGDILVTYALGTSLGLVSLYLAVFLGLLALSVWLVEKSND